MQATMINGERLLPLSHAATVLKVPYLKPCNLMNTGVLDGRDVAGRRYVTLVSVKRYAREHAGV